jgi:hypothetical protein
MTAAPNTERRLDLLTTLLLALATVLTAWAAYQSRQWTGEQAQATSKATADRIAENRSAALANRQVQIDVATFIQWLDARAARRPALAAFYRERFRPEFRPAFAGWLAAQPFRNPAAPPTPFAMPGYRLRATTEAERLERAAASQSERSKRANQRAANDMLGVVFFASALFFAGISAKLQTSPARMTILGLGWLMFLGAAIWIATVPVKLTT